MLVNMNLPVQRWKRETMEKSDAHQEKSSICEDMEIASVSAGVAADLAGDAGTAAGAIPILGIPFVIAFAAIAAANHAFKGVLDIAIIVMDCSSSSSDENKKITERHETTTEPAQVSEVGRRRRQIEVTAQAAGSFLVSSKLRKEIPGLINYEEVTELKNYNLFDNPEPIFINAKSLFKESGTKTNEKTNLHGNHINKSPDLVGLMFLIDVFLKKMNGQTYKSFGGDIKASIQEARAAALNLTNRFEQFLKTSSKLIPSEHIDVSKVYSDILRAVVSNNVNKLPRILRSYSEAFTDIKTTAFETFLKDNALALSANIKRKRLKMRDSRSF